MIILENKKGRDARQARAVLERLRELGLNVNDVRVDFDHIEVDLNGSYNGIEDAVEEKVLEVKSVEEEGDAMLLICAGRFWEAHEALEKPWRSLKGDQAESYRKAILFCAAMVHMQRGDADGFKRILERAAAIKTGAVIVERCLSEALNAINDGVDQAYATARSACSRIC